MTRKLHYFAQPFWAARQDPAQRYEFTCAVDAEDGGEILATAADGVLVYQQWIDTESGAHDDPEILAVHGTVPSGAVCIDGDPPPPWSAEVV